MIDKPMDKVDQLIEDLFTWCKETKAKVFEKTEPYTSQAKKFKAEKPRLAATIIAATSILIFALLIVGFTTPKTVIVNIDDSVEVTTIQYETTCMRVDSFIDEHQIDYVYGQDIIDRELYNGINDGMEINIKKALKLSVTADGKTDSVITLPVTTAELLDNLDIELKEFDIVEPALDKKLEKGDNVVVKRVIKGTVTTKAVTEPETVYYSDYSLAIGDTAVVEEGSMGLESRKYSVTYVDGVETERTLIETTTLVEKQDRIIASGRAFIGTPSGLQYQKVISMKAVAYYYGGNPHGSYGLPCEYGTVAVDKNVIPLGSLLYIEDYGYAIANDVGGAIKGNIIDLYMEDYDQCLYWGAHRVNVYILQYA